VRVKEIPITDTLRKDGLMLNRAPIFVNGFSFGGTNMITNLLASHPEVCWLSGETHEVFYSKPRKKMDKWIRRFFYLPVQISAGSHVFGRECLDERGRLSVPMMRYIDLFFYIDKLSTDRNEYKSEDVRYLREEIKRCRFLAKNVNGVVLASSQFSQIYPDATFLALVRNGLALCEGYVRRGWRAEDAGRLYETVCQKVIQDSRTIQNYHIVRFEEMVSDPLGFMKKIYSFAGLEESRVEKVRLQAKKSMNEDGTRSYTFGGSKDRETHWFTLEELRNYVRKGVNENQIDRLSPRDKETFLSQAKSSMELLGY